MGKMTVNDHEIAWPDEQDDVVATAVQASSNVAGKTTAEILANWAIHEANSYRDCIIGWIAEKAQSDSLGTALDDADAAREVAKVDAETTVTVKRTVVEPA